MDSFKIKKGVGYLRHCQHYITFLYNPLLSFHPYTFLYFY